MKNMKKLLHALLAFAAVIIFVPECLCLASGMGYKCESNPSPNS